MKAYHGSQEIKDKFVSRMQAHMDADELVRGTGFENGRGCAVGCTLNKYDHSAFPAELGVPEWAARLLDALHENTSAGIWPTLSIRFLSAIKPGANLGSVRNEINLFILRRNRARVESLDDLVASVRDQVIAAIDQCIDLHISELRGVIDLSAWSAARSAAWSAARSAAESAQSVESAESAESVESAAWSARSAEWSARSAAWSAEEEARSAAWSAARSAARSAAESAQSVESVESAESAAWSAQSAEFDAIAEEFIRLLERAQ